MSKKLLISKIRTKRFLKMQNLRVSSDFYGALNDELLACLARAGRRAKGNNRLTVLAKDV